VQKFKAPGRTGDHILCGTALYLWVPNMKHGSHHHFGTLNFKLTPRFLKNL